MKRLIMVCCLLAISLVAAGEISGYFSQVALQAGVYTSSMTEEGWEFDGNACFYGAMLEEGESVSTTRYFEKGVNYNVWGFGDEDANDLDIKITDSNGKMIIEDTSDDDYPNCTFKPKSSGSYKITVTNYDSDDMVLVLWGVMTDSDSDFYNTGGKCADALLQAIQFFEYLDENADAGDYYFLLNKVCMIGGIMPEGDTQCFYNFSVPEDGSCFFVGFGSEEVEDFDIKVCQQRKLDDINTDYENDEYRLIGEDSTDDAVAVVTGILRESKYYALKYRNYSSSESGFVFTIILGQ